MFNSNFIIKPNKEAEKLLQLLNENNAVLKTVGSVRNGDWCLNNGSIEFTDSFNGELQAFFVETCILLAAKAPSVGFSAEGDYFISSGGHREYCEAVYADGILKIETDFAGREDTFAVRIIDGPQQHENIGYLKLTVLGEQEYAQALLSVIASDSLFSCLKVDGNSVSLNIDFPLYDSIMSRVSYSFSHAVAKAIPDCAFITEWQVSNCMEDHKTSGFVDYFDYFFQYRKVTDNTDQMGICKKCGNSVFDAKSARESARAIRLYVCKECSNVFELSCDYYYETTEDMAPEGYRESETRVIIPDGITRIPDNAYKDCISLQDVVLPDSLSVIGDDAFSGCTALKGLMIPDSVLILGKDFCYRCTSMEKIRLPASAIIQGCAFCTSLKEVILPDGVSRISMRAFTGCSSIETILLPDSLKSIDGMAFDGTKLKEIRIPPDTKILTDTWPCFPKDCVLHVLKDSPADKYAKKLKHHVKRYKIS